MRKILIVITLLITLSVSAQEKSQKFRDRTEYFSISLAGSAMGLGLQLSSPTLKWKYVFWEIVNLEGVFPTFGYYTIGGAGYTKLGYYHYFTQKSELRVSAGFGGGYFFSGNIIDYESRVDPNCYYSPGVCYFYGFYLQPEVSYVHNFNEKYALAIGVQFPLIFPRFFKYPYKLFIGFRY
jgi:hypothetical protein